MNGYPMRAQYRQKAKEVTVPQYYKHLPGSLILEDQAAETLLSRVHLLEEFRLAGKDTEINFSAAPSRAYSLTFVVVVQMQTNNAPASIPDLPK